MGIRDQVLWELPINLGKGLETRQTILARVLMLTLLFCLACAGRSAAAGSVVVAPTSLSFVSQVLSTTSAPQTVTLSNNQSRALKKLSFTSSGDFAISANTCGTQLKKRQNCFISVTFMPTAMGKRSGTLQIIFKPAKFNQTVTLAGTGIALVSIGVSPRGAPLVVGKTQQFSAAGRFSDGSTKDLTSSVVWSSSNASVATIAGSGLATAIADGSATIDATSASVTGSGAVIVTPTCATGTGSLTVGSDEEHILDVGQFGTEFTPDEHPTYMRQPDGSIRLWIAGGTTMGAGETIGFTTNDFVNLTPLNLSGGNAVASLEPSGPGTSKFDADYSGPGAVIKASNGTDLLMFYHGENHLFGGVDYQTVPFYASVGLARSNDGGLTWSRVGQIISGSTPQSEENLNPPCGAGANNPSAIVAGGYIYVYYVDFGCGCSCTSVGPGPGSIHLARAPIASDGAPGSWLKYYNGNFTEPGLGGLSTPVQGPVPPGPPTEHVALNPDVSYNTYLQSYVLFFITQDGWYYSTSPDLVAWTLQRRIFSGPDITNPNKNTGDAWYDYQAMISPEQINEQTTSCAGFVYYAKGFWNVTPHSMYRRSFSLGGP